MIKAEQICFVVKDVDKELNKLKDIGLKDWVIDAANTPIWACYNGNIVSYTFKMAFYEFGNIQLELLQVMAGDTRHNKLIEGKDTAFSHVGYHVENLMDELKKYLDMGAFLEQFAVTNNHCYAYITFLGLPIKIIQRLYK